MKIAAGIVVEGKVVVEGEPLEEGSAVAVVLPDEEEVFELSPEEEAALLDSQAEIRRGQFVTPEQLLEKLRRFG